MADITMPQLGETVTEGTITRWAKKVGDHVDEDEVLFEVSTDKVDSEVPSPAAGTLAQILVQEGETADVGAKLAVIDEPGSAGGSQAAAPAEATPAEAPTAPKAGDNGKSPAAEEQAEPEESVMADVAVDAQESAADESHDDGAPSGDGRAAAPATTKAPPEPEPETAEGEGDGDSGGGSGLVLSPVVRRLLKEHNLRPEQVRASGAGGRITRADVLAVIDSRGGAPAPTQAPAPAEQPSPRRAPVAAPAEQPAARAEGVPAGQRDEVVAFSNIRRRTADHMRRSIDTSAHTLVVSEVDYEAVDKARLPARNRFKADEGFSLTYLPFVARAVVDAIAEFPFVNASVGDNELVVHHYVNLGFAVDLNLEGLIVPVVHDAGDKRLRALAREVADLAARARSRKLTADEISGGTFTITNPGSYGTLLTAPIINQPQVAILSTDGVKQKPVAVALPGGGYGVAVHPVGNLALSFDHRAFDGAYASAFLARLREIVETRDWSAELA